MVSQLLVHQRIETTLPKAKELRRVADQVVTISKEVKLQKLSHAKQPSPLRLSAQSTQTFCLFLIVLFSTSQLAVQLSLARFETSFQSSARMGFITCYLHREA